MIDNVKYYIRQDPVRPHIPAESRISLGREMYHIDEQAFICLAFVDRVRFSRLVTFSPKTEMAKKFHLSNGATLLQESPHAYNFEYNIK